MDEPAIIEQLEELARGFGIEIRHEPILVDEETITVVGGLCVLRGKHLLIINSKTTEREKIKALVESLRHFDLDQTYISPAVRVLFELGGTRHL